MSLLGRDFTPLKCPMCGIVAIKLLKVFDKGKETEVCRYCKKRINKEKVELLKGVDLG